MLKMDMDNSVTTPLSANIQPFKNNLKYLLGEVLNCFSRMVLCILILVFLLTKKLKANPYKEVTKSGIITIISEARKLKLSAKNFVCC